MRPRKLSRIFFGLLLLFAAIVGFTSINHPVVLKWLTGSARIIGRPMSAVIYTDGHLNPAIEIYRVNSNWNNKEIEYFLIHFLYADTKETRKIICVSPEYNLVGRPSSTNKRDYDKVFGILFQSEVGSKFNSFKMI